MSKKFPEPNRKTTTAFRDLVIISAIFILVSVLVDVFRVFAIFQEWVREQPQWSEWRIHDYLFTFVILALALGVFSLRRWIELRREIAERKRAERELRLLAQTVASAKDCISITDLNNNILFVNNAFVDMYGYAQEELFGKNISVVRSPDVPPEVDQEIGAACLTKAWHGEVLNRRKDGSDFLIELWTSIVRDDSGEPVALVGIARDITERKQAQDLLQKSEALYRTLAEAAHDAIFIENRDGYLEYMNSFAAEQLGKRPEEVIGKRREDIFPPHVVDQINQQLADIWATGKPMCIESIVVLKGQPSWASTWVVPIKNELGEINAVMGVARDITERKRMEETLKKSEKQLSLAQDVASLGSWDADLMSNTVLWSPQLYRMLDIDPQEGPASLETFIGHIHPDDRENVKQIIEQALRDGKSFELEHRAVRKDGSVRNLWAKGFVSRDEFGRPTRVFGIEQDITERKRAEEALRESEERFTAFMNNSPVVAWLKDPATWTYHYINKAFAEVFEITPEVISKKTDFDLWPEEIARQLRENDLGVMSSDRTIQTSEDVPLPNGTVHHWLVFKFPLHTPSGKPFLAGTAVDITERKQAEEERERLILELKDALANVRQLGKLLPICASCKKIRDDRGYWTQVEKYLMDHSEATFSHGVCPECMQKLYPEYNQKIQKAGDGES